MIYYIEANISRINLEQKCDVISPMNASELVVRCLRILFHGAKDNSTTDVLVDVMRLLHNPLEEG